jgi:hypothetical protein
MNNLKTESNVNQNDELFDVFKSYFNTQVKRVLTQLDRDKDSPTYGCFDRNYWHYKIRDFPSSILQQGAFVTEYVRKHYQETGLISEKKAGEWSLAAINALAKQVRRGGRVDEYYPYEDSYPASAFSLYAVMRILLDWKKNNPDLIAKVEWEGLSRLAKNLATREEPNAANQYATGLAGLAMAAKLPEMDIPENIYVQHASRLFSLQHTEGWFNEYGGPDFGYLCVTIDALTDYYDVTCDERAPVAVERAIDFMARLVGVDGELPWTLNARNTDYIVPYGLVRAARNNPVASWLVHELFRNINKPVHWIWSTDDRYHLHYIFCSLTRAIPFINEMTTGVQPKRDEVTWLPGCGYYVLNQTYKATLYVATKKGGLIRIHAPNEHSLNLSDNGWRFKSKNTLWTTNWWHEYSKVDIEKNTITISGKMVMAKFHKSKPLPHFILRILSFTVGKYLIPMLKKMMIFRTGNNQSPIYKRKIKFGISSVTIIDEFHSSKDLIAYPSPRQNLRHVASADSFHPEESLASIHAEQTHTIKSKEIYVVEKEIENVF